MYCFKSAKCSWSTRASRKRAKMPERYMCCTFPPSSSHNAGRVVAPIRCGKQPCRLLIGNTARLAASKPPCQSPQTTRTWPTRYVKMCFLLMICAKTYSMRSSIQYIGILNGSKKKSFSNPQGSHMLSTIHHSSPFILNKPNAPVGSMETNDFVAVTKPFIKSV